MMEVIHPPCRFLTVLGQAPTIFYAKILTIDICAQEKLKYGMIIPDIYICSDYQAMLITFKANIFESTLWEYLTNIVRLAPHFEDNEMADRLLNQGASSQL